MPVAIADSGQAVDSPDLRLIHSTKPVAQPVITVRRHGPMAKPERQERMNHRSSPQILLLQLEFRHGLRPGLNLSGLFRCPKD